MEKFIPNRALSKVFDGGLEVQFRFFIRTGDWTADLECGHKIDHSSVPEIHASPEFVASTQHDGLDYNAIAMRFFEEDHLPCVVCTFIARPEVIAMLPPERLGCDGPNND